MSYFAGLELGSKDCKVKHIVVKDGDTVEQVSPVIFWTVYEIGGGKRLLTPVSKLDFDRQTMIVPAQLLGAYHDRSRSIIRKTNNGTSVSPFGGIIV